MVMDVLLVIVFGLCSMAFIGKKVLWHIGLWWSMYTVSTSINSNKPIKQITDSSCCWFVGVDWVIVFATWSHTFLKMYLYDPLKVRVHHARPQPLSLSDWQRFKCLLSQVMRVAQWATVCPFLTSYKGHRLSSVKAAWLAITRLWVWILPTSSLIKKWQ